MLYPLLFISIFLLLTSIHPLLPIAILAIIFFIFYFTSKKKLSPPQTSTLSDSEAVELYRWNKRTYLKSKDWKDKRLLVLKRDNFTCQSCSSTSQLSVHHIYYSKLGNEPLDHLITLCQPCHQSLHEEKGYPQTVEEYYTFEGNI
jgi:hypothetical protein